MCLKIENDCLKIFVKICMGEKSILIYMKCCLKTKNGGLKTQTKHPLNFSCFMVYTSVPTITWVGQILSH